MKRLILYLVAFSLAAFLFAASVSADTLKGSVGDGWQTWTTANLNGNGTPYWDGTSSDGTGYGVGYYIANFGPVFNSSTGTNPQKGTGPGVIPFWGQTFTSSNDTTGGAADSSFYFTPDGAGETATLKLSVTGLTGIDEFGYYLLSSPSTLDPLFHAGDSLNAPKTITITGDYGFYLYNNSFTYGGPTLWRTQSGSNYVYTGEQHFAVFAQNLTPGSQIYWIGSEDLTFNYPSDKDYNDIVVKIQTVPGPVPEPATMLLLGSGLIGLAGFARRKFKK